jgi:two-component system, OmpR family, response regulator
MGERNKYKILLVEDEVNFGDVLKSYLEMQDFSVTWAMDGVAGAEAFRKGDFDLCILDVMMPKKDGFTLGAEIRSRDQEIPLIFLTAKNMKEDVLKGFEIGADDFISKPFNSEVLLARIQAILKRTLGKADGFGEEEPLEYKVGDYIFHYLNRTLSLGDQKAVVEKLSPKEAELLKIFASNFNKVVTRKEALEKVWGEDNYFTARSMDVFVTRLRKRLKGDERLVIENIHGNGFKLCEAPS